ncbi:aldo/keto reductase [Nocardioides pinisoli]|uniref:Aldo/keto reductase n=1 Tax=Nocardioides pinisoli TaxID=2950279 RepID=A0ABT1KYK6_9ACTN|nr:aldo/keto reductase [Nocardioides pinisoli]MCP3422855.1 aldo/keto reductase [Nocardioides pinisoli]
MPDPGGPQTATPQPDRGSQDRRWGDALALPLGLGTNTFGRTTDAAGSHAVLDRFAAAGGTLVDTADTYSDGAAETILGEWLRDRGNRDRMVVVSKVGNHARFDGLAAPVVTAAVDESLRRLGTDHLDLCFAHYQDVETPVEESAVAFDALVRAGKVRAYGLSNFDADTVARWLRAAEEGGLAAPVALQPHYSLVHREPYESALAPLAAASDLAVLPYRALGGGFLSGKYRTRADTEGRARGAGVTPLLTPAGLALLDAVEAVARDHEVAPASVALAWLRVRPHVVAPLASATDATQLDEVVASSTVELGPDELHRLDEASALLG